MGTWGVGLYADDAAVDVKSLIKDLKTFGLSGEVAARIVVEQVDPNETASWLALADLLWKDGRLPDEYRDKALNIIRSGQDIERWSDTASKAKRAKILAELEAKLTLPQPEPKNLRKAFIDHSPWGVGEIITYEHSNGLTVALRVVGYFTRFGGQSPVFETLDWNNHRAPTEREARSLSLLHHQSTPPGQEDLVPGYREPQRQLSLWKSKGWLPDDATWEDWKKAWCEPYFALVRHSEKLPELKKLTSVCKQSASPRRYFPRVLTVNGWHLWKDLETVLAGYFPRYRWEGWPSRMDRPPCR